MRNNGVGKAESNHGVGLVAAASLSAIDLFKDLPASCLEALEARSEVRQFPAGHVFFHEGGAARYCSFLKQAGADISHLALKEVDHRGPQAARSFWRNGVHRSMHVPLLRANH